MADTVDIYGKATFAQIDAMRNDNKILRSMYRRGHIQKFYQYPPPPNNSEYTRNELKYIAQMGKNLSGDRRNFINSCNDDILRMYSEVVLKRGIYADVEMMADLVLPYNSVILLLKYKFNRPRPYQIAKSRGVLIIPCVENLPNNPSYPSGHAISVFILADYFSTKYPDHTEFFWDAANDMSLSRIQGGVHYPSDEFAGYLFYRMLKHYNYFGW